MAGPANSAPPGVGKNRGVKGEENGDVRGGGMAGRGREREGKSRPMVISKSWHLLLHSQVTRK